MFIDEALISVKAGHGGAGCVSFHRDRNTARGGPDGGDGGRGGDVIFRSLRGESTLTRFRYNRIFNAESGGHGQGSRCHGKDGADIILPIPCGTIIKNSDTGEVLRDMKEDGQEFVVVRGGIGGKGNEHFKSSTFRSPKFAQPGMPGEEFNLKLELKLLADVGLVGLPNAGKSTLISRITSAKPAIADYPFTTLHPKIGVVESDEGSFVVGDMPGLIEGASEGKGLGTKFLKHIERSAILCHLIDVSHQDLDNVMTDFDIVQNELERYSGELTQKRELVVLTKIDAVTDSEALAKIEEAFRSRDIETISISAVSGKNLQTLVRRMRQLVDASRAKRDDPPQS